MPRLQPRIAFLLQRSQTEPSAGAEPSLSMLTTEIVARLRELGYLYVAVDLAGLQSGSANLLLNLKRTARG